MVVGEWDVFAPQGERLTIDNDMIDFSMMKRPEDVSVDEESNKTLVSVCSQPCPPRHSLVREDTPCCWECNECRSNEVLIKNGTVCQRCPKNEWPDDDAGTECIPIDPTFLDWKSPIAITLLLVAIIGVIVGLVVIVVFYLHRDHKLVRATSRGLSNFILCGSTVACLDVFLVVCRPTTAVCITRRVVFHVGVTLMYAPLFIKTVRIYRVFVNSLKGLQKVKFVSSSQQIAFASVVVLIQVLKLILQVSPISCLLVSQH